MGSVCTHDLGQDSPVASNVLKVMTEVTLLRSRQCSFPDTMLYPSVQNKFKKKENLAGVR